MNPQQLLVSHETSLGGTVLVVDDDDATCQLLGQWVRLLGFDVMTAHGAPSHKRYSGGSDVRAACGQLAGAS